ncbi:MAG: hypothetical protein V4463_05570 [Pseudomonadota bacterium]
MREDGRIIGISTVILRGALARAGIVHDIDQLPLKRDCLQVQRRADTCVYSTTRTPERETQFQWIGPTRIIDWTIERALYLYDFEAGRLDRKDRAGADV